MAKTAAELEARIAELEAENRALRERDTAVIVDGAAGDGAGSGAGEASARTRGRWRAPVSAVLVVLGIVLAPVALIGGWARLELVDTDRFVQTFGPLADDPAVQAYLVDQVTTVIDEQVDIDGLTASVFDGIRSLDLPPRAQDALGLLEGPAAAGLHSLVERVVGQVVASETFADVWNQALRISHTQFVAAVQGDPDAALELSGDGTVSVQLGPIVEAAKQRLIDQGVGFASAIPTIDRSIEILQADSLALVRTVYTLAVAVGFWLPFVSIALMVGGVLIARRRTTALVWTAGGFALAMLTLGAGIGIGQSFFIATVSPSIMPSDAAEALYEQLVELMRGSIAALFLLGLLVALFAWFSGPYRPATAVRGAATSAFDGLRSAGDRHGVGTGRFGEWLDRWRVGAYVLIAVVAAAVVLFTRPITIGLVVWTVVLALVALLLVQVLRRPAPQPAEVAPAG
ncbi:hypothetical protein FLP10_12995 [Agromyces intestinalis]|uniref:Integral membrane protein n=1 Tax=Agromyces intestinalis TaxID=2592652 RepID=A0A5C1YJH1_9MICO|nr:hypothetical protein [Agromyces intestinalis]QEO15237.1 hypothetical protein FLP10_12995 [Agromyces intestinalis]